MINNEWPKIRADLDNGRLSPIGLIHVKSADPAKLDKNHQVLAYGYELDRTDLSIHLYDPNYDDNDTITMSLSIADPQHTTPVTYPRGIPVWCFFRPDYLFIAPPAPVAFNWHPIGHANNVVAMAAINNKLFAATRDNVLWVRHTS
jgi:hypothetical protein